MFTLGLETTPMRPGPPPYLAEPSHWPEPSQLPEVLGLRRSNGVWPAARLRSVRGVRQPSAPKPLEVGDGVRGAFLVKGFVCCMVC